MSDDMDKKIKQIAEMLGQNQNANIPDNVKGILNMFMSSNNTNDDDSDDSGSSRSEGKSNQSDADDMIDMTRKMKKAMDMLNTSNDPRMNLLNAIKPYLNSTRQKKLQTCVKLIRIGSLTRVLDDSDERSI